MSVSGAAPAGQLSVAIPSSRLSGASLHEMARERLDVVESGRLLVHLPQLRSRCLSSDPQSSRAPVTSSHHLRSRLVHQSLTCMVICPRQNAAILRGDRARDLKHHDRLDVRPSRLLDPRIATRTRRRHEPGQNIVRTMEDVDLPRWRYGRTPCESREKTQKSTHPENDWPHDTTMTRSVTVCNRGATCPISARPISGGKRGPPLRKRRKVVVSGRSRTNNPQTAIA
jgi:hypothetical protein